MFKCKQATSRWQLTCLMRARHTPNTPHSNRSTAAAAANSAWATMNCHFTIPSSFQLRVTQVQGCAVQDAGRGWARQAVRQGGSQEGSPPRRLARHLVLLNQPLIRRVYVRWLQRRAFPSLLSHRHGCRGGQDGVLGMGGGQASTSGPEHAVRESTRRGRGWPGQQTSQESQMSLNPVILWAPVTCPASPPSALPATPPSPPPKALPCHTAAPNRAGRPKHSSSTGGPPANAGPPPPAGNPSARLHHAPLCIAPSTQLGTGAPPGPPPRTRGHKVVHKALCDRAERDEGLIVGRAAQGL